MVEDYIFQDAGEARERQRLHAIEAVFDPATRRRLTATGLGRGWRCLEVGPGAGSILDWLADQVGDEGHVTGLDLDPRFLADVDRRNVTIERGDLGALDRPAEFDLVHARYVLVHVADPERALDRMLASLRPGGWLVVEEPDFSATRALAGAVDQLAGFDRVARACLRMFADGGKDGALGGRLPALLRGRGLASVGFEHDAPIVPGGSEIAQMMSLSTTQLRRRYIATGEAGSADVDAYLCVAADPTSAAIYYATIAASAQRGERNDEEKR